MRETTIIAVCGVVLATACGQGTGEEGLASRAKGITAAGGNLELARDRIRQHFEERRAQLDIVATTKTSFGQIIDWTEPTEEELRYIPPPLPRPLPPPPEGFHYAKSPLETEPDARGPAGTIPHVRPDIEGLLAAWGDKVPDDPERLFDIMPTPSGPEPGVRRYYAERKSTHPSTQYYKGLEARISLWNVAQLSSGDTSIMQILLGSGKDTIESGKSESTIVHGGAPHFFVFFTNNNYDQAKTSGYCDPYPASVLSGGYVTGTNAYSLGYLTRGGTNWPPDLVFADPNTNPGQLMDNTWVKDAASGVWNLYVNGESAGQFYSVCWVGDPHNLDTRTMWHPTDGTSNGGLRTGASTVEWYGEVFDSASTCSGSPTVCSPATSTDMGNGQKATGASPAWMDWMYLMNSSGSWIGYNSIPGVQLSQHTTDANCYSQSSVSGNKWYLGGGGDEESGCN
jgi:hypothetical protein